MSRKNSLYALAASLFVAACGQTQETEEEMLLRTARDVRVPIPEPTSEYVDFVGLDTVIKPGEDRMICVHMRYDGEDLTYSLADSAQGKFGHHFIAMKAKKPMEPGTVEDCSKPEDMSKYDILMMPGFEVPQGYGMFLPKGTPIVAQSHYINSTTQPLRVRDVLRFKKIDPSTVKTWAAAYSTNSLDLKIPALGAATHSFDCTFPVDAKLMLVGGHMHEWGTKFQFEVGPNPGAMQTLYNVDQWTTDFRDNPPINYMKESPIPVAKGSILRTTCSWKSDQDHELIFPHEMCAAFALLTGTKQPFVCNHGEQQ